MAPSQFASGAAMTPFPDAHAPLRVIELRQYTLRPGRRDELIGLFEQKFIEPQEALGMRIVGTFRDLDDPDRFVWLRGFADLSARADALAAFYGGPVWQRYRDEANATMVDSDDVFLLRPATARDSFAQAQSARAEADVPPPRPPGLVTATLCPLRAGADAALQQAFDEIVRPAWIGAEGELLACLVSEIAPNNFPRLPVREGEPVMAWFTRFADTAAQERHAAFVAASGCLQAPGWRERLAASPTTRRLVATHRSALRA
jgi:hypothetical protein